VYYPHRDSLELTKDCADPVEHHKDKELIEVAEVAEVAEVTEDWPDSIDYYPHKNSLELTKEVATNKCQLFFLR
jgi:hypothetical protein